MSNSASTSNANSVAALTAIQTAEDTQFIATVDALIAAAATRGSFQVTATTSLNVNLPYIYNYYSNLGYKVGFPDFPTNLAAQPANLFGAYWQAYWQNNIANQNIKNPSRMTFVWG